MNLIVDNGGTKATWSISNGTQILKQFTTSGIYPFHVNDQQFIDYIELAKKEFPYSIKQIFFYSTGCSVLAQRLRIKALFRTVFSNAETIEVETDLLAAARALCGHKPGIACIMGTGSNSCNYDGKQVLDNYGGLGFILGDEGSGAVMGKQLIQDYLGRQLPADLKLTFERECPVERGEVLECVYQKPAANKYLASFAPFIHRHKNHPYLAQMIHRQFVRFFQKYITGYEAYQSLPIHFLGSISIFFAEELASAATAFQLEVASFVQSPMNGLVRYHASERVFDAN